MESMLLLSISCSISIACSSAVLLFTAALRFHISLVLFVCRMQIVEGDEAGHASGITLSLSAVQVVQIVLFTCISFIL